MGQRAGRGTMGEPGGELLGTGAPQAPADGVGEGRRRGVTVAGPPCRVATAAGGRGRPRGVRETHLPHLSQAG